MVVNILIKAPNQMVDDLLVECKRNWTVRRLKNHLSEDPSDQKLIYSGQLLCDGSTLSEVLRSYEGQENNTIHLVCSRSTVYQRTQVKTNQPEPTIPVQPQSSTSNENLYSNNPNPYLRGGIPFFTPRINVPENINVFRNNDTTDNELRNHVERMQEAYAQYITHYMRIAYNRCNNTGAEIDETFENNSETLEAETPQNEPGEDVPGEGNEVLLQNRDLLEWAYILFRLGVLFTFVYFNSSPLRLVFVLAMVVFLFYIDIERYRHRNVPTEEPEETSPDDNVTPVPQRTNIFSVIWSFISLFFLSLVPDLIY